MNIGFDAKRAYHNRTGLGNFSRTLIHLLSGQYPEHRYFLFNPRHSSEFELKDPAIQEILPHRLADKLFPAAWRSSWVKNDLKRLKINIYHGVSHEIPIGIQHTGIPAIVTIHDLIHERYPEQYNPIDVRIYRKKFRYACKHADMIMAISQQTKNDIIELYNIPEEKVVVCYQSCNPVFAKPMDNEENERVKKKYELPEKYFLYVGAIIERKNLLNICKAIFISRNELDIPLVIAGDGGKYKEQVKEYIRQHQLQDRVIFLYEKEQVARSSGFIPLDDMPPIYQSATAMIYPSSYEGFGVPVLEALLSRLPVITSNISSLPEVAGPGSYYVDPGSPEQIAAGMKRIYSDKFLARIMRDKGWEHALKFSPEQYVNSVMNLYKSVW